MVRIVSIALSTSINENSSIPGKAKTNAYEVGFRSVESEFIHGGDGIRRERMPKHFAHAFGNIFAAATDRRRRCLF